MKATAVRAGFLTSVQDLGRTGFRELGVSSGGALDLRALRVANLLVGNQESAAGLEITFGGLRLRFSDTRIVAWCGAGFRAEIDSKPVPAGHPAAVRAGEQLRIDSPTGGCRAWLAISGGVDVEPVLGSRSTDLRSGFGGFQGRALRDGDELSFGETSPRAKTLIQKLQRETIGRWAPPHEWSNPARRNPLLRFVRGRNIDLFDDALIERFTSQTFHVSPDSDRMGIRLNGTSLERVNKSDLLSEAVAPGTVQVPPGGHPIVLLNDCQTIGGYPKIAHVITVDLPVAAQVCPGDPVKFSEVSLTDAHTLLLTLEQKLQQFRRGLETVST